MVTFENRPAKTVTLWAFGVFAALGVCGVLAGSWSGLVLLAVGVLAMTRAWRSATVVVRDSDIELRGFLRTRRIPLASLDHAEVAVGQTGMNGYGREYLTLLQRDGAALAFKELNAKPSPVGTEVQSAVRQINSTIGYAP